MQSGMIDKTGMLRKYTVTDCAYKWFLASVFPTMDIKVISC